MELWHIPIVFAAGFIGESYGALVGGGSIVIQSVLIFLGVPLQSAIATDIAGALGTEAGIIQTTWHSIMKQWRLVLLISISGTLGGIAGTTLLIGMPTTYIKGLMVAAVTGLILYLHLGSARWIAMKNNTVLIIIVFLLIGTYSNLLSIGEGTFGKIAVMSLAGLTFIQSHGVKTMATIPARIYSLIVTAMAGLIVWPYLITLLFATYLAGLASTNIAKRVPERYARAFITAAAIIFLAYLIL